MYRYSRVLAAAAVTAFTLSAASPTLAQTCQSDVGLPPFAKVTPSSSDHPVPTNTWIWYAVGNAQDVAPSDGVSRLELLSMQSGSSVGLDQVGVISTADTLLFAFQPVDDLDPTTDYELEFARRFEPSSTQLADTDLLRVSFRTGEGPDEEVPPVPVELGRELYTDYNQLGVGCEVTDYQDEASFFLDSEGYFNLLARQGGGLTFGEGLFTEVGAISETAEVELFGDIGVGASMSVRWSTVDLAGNFSGWSEEVDDRMPPSGCVSTGDGRISQAALLPTGLLMLGPLARRRRTDRRARRRVPSGRGPTRALLPSLGLVALLTGLVASPAAARTDIDPAERKAIQDRFEGERETSSPEWKTQADRWLARDQTGWGAAALGFGALQSGLLLAQPFRAPYALQLSLANTITWLPSLSTFLAIQITRAALRGARSVKRLRRGLKAVEIPVGILSIVAWQALIPAAILAGSYDPAISIALLGIPMSMAFVAIAAATMSQYVKNAGRRLSRVDRRPRVVAAGPTALVVRF